MEIDKIRNTAEIFPFLAKFVFDWLLKSFWVNCVEKKNRLRNLFSTYAFFSLIIIFTVIFFFSVNRGSISLKEVQEAPSQEPRKQKNKFNKKL